MSRLLCCLQLRPRTPDMGAALNHPQEGDASEGVGLAVAPPTMADVIRERKKKAGGAGLGTLRRRLAAAARRPRDARPDRGCEHARFIRSVVSTWRLPEVWALCQELEAAAALRDLATQAELARQPAPTLQRALHQAYTNRWWCDVELAGAGFSIPAHRAILSARCQYFRDLLQRYPSGQWRVPLDGVASSLSRSDMEAAIQMIYGGSSRRDHCCKWNRGSDADLDIISGDNTGTCGSSRGCTCLRPRPGGGDRLTRLLGLTPDADLGCLLHSGEHSDCRLVFRVEGGGAQYGFRAALELPAHRLVLAARSRFFRNVLSRRSSSAGGGCVCVDERVLPRRFARALLHAAYTDQVDLSLIGRASGSPSSTASSGTTGSSAWAGVGRSGSSSAIATLDDAFQLYEIGRFLEMPIVVQGCEDCVLEALTADTLPHVLRWATQPHASQWVHRQAMRYFRDEFPSVMWSPAAASLPRAALRAALADNFLQASEVTCLRALLRWGLSAAAAPREPNVLWHTAHARRARRRDAGDAALRETLGPLLALVRTEHVPPDNELLQQAIRRGILPAPRDDGGAAPCSPLAWLGRGGARPARCFLPHLDELRALLQHQPRPDPSHGPQHIPDTLYMVAAGRCPPSPAPGAAVPLPGAAHVVSGRVLASLRHRIRELTAAPPAARALAQPHADRRTIVTQIALRAVREMSLPDACAELLLREPDDADHDTRDRERSSSSGGGEWEGELRHEPWLEPDCCRSVASGGGSSTGSLRCSGSLRAAAALHVHVPPDAPRAATCRRDTLAHVPDSHRAGVSDMAGRLSACVPDVAMAPNANTHLLTARDYCAHPAPPEYSPAGVLQLDLGDGATHTPRPGSRALRAAHSAERARQHRDHTQSGCVPPSRSRPDEDELRAALELSVIRAYSSFQPSSRSPAPAPAASAPIAPLAAATLPPPYRDLPAYAAVRGRASTVEASLAGPAHSTGRLRRDNGRGGSSTLDRREREPPPAYRHDYRLDPSYGSSGSGSRGQSPNNYA